jgi:23S rRNA (guanosine2251-2'-O)-methyltransferase
MFIYGRNSVLQRLKVNPQSISKVFLDEDFKESSILDIIKKKKVPAIRLGRREFLRMRRLDCLQGIIAQVDNFSYTPFKELLEVETYGHTSLNVLIFLDSISDPQNLGSMIRTLACLGGFAIVLPRHNACEVNETVLHVACGGENFVPVSMVTNFSNALIEAKKSGYWIAGAVVEGGQDLNKTTFSFPLAIVLGSEGRGIRQGLLSHLDFKISLPMPGVSLSFNAAVACAIFCYEIAKQRPITSDPGSEVMVSGGG